MEIKKIALMLAAVLGILCVLGALLARANHPLSPEESRAVEKARAERDFSLSPAEVSRGEDYIISWQDAGMEAHVRFLLNRPEGAISHSDLWDIRCLAIYGYPSTPFDLMAEGDETLTRNNTLENPNRWRYWEKREFPPIASLEDLRHFDSLQIFCLFQEKELLNPNIEQCDNLQILELDMGGGAESN